MNTTQETSESHNKEHGKLLSFCLFEKDYSQGGQTNSKIQINRDFYAPDGLIIPKPGEQG